MAASKVRNRARTADNENDPCWEEGNMSVKCLHDNNFQKSKCQIYFENYKNCQKFWVFSSYCTARKYNQTDGETDMKNVIADRSKNNQFPELPPPEEREKVRLEYQASSQ